MPHIPFMALAKRFYILSLVLVAVIIAASFIMGVELDVEFRGGSIITYSYDGAIDKDRFAEVAQDLASATIAVQESKDVATGKETLIITMPGSTSLTSEQMIIINDGLEETFPENNLNTVSISNVSASIGSEFLTKSMMAIALASLLMIVYVAFRFRKIGGWSAGVMGVLALVHDVIIVYGVFVICRFPISGNFIAAVLTIIGFSLNDTIVIYDRIRENKGLLGDKLSLSELVELSINQSFQRSVNTSIAALLSMIIVTVVAFIFGVESIFTFSFPMILGLISGVYSTVCLAGPLWVRWQEYKESRAK